VSTKRNWAWDYPSSTISSITSTSKKTTLKQQRRKEKKEKSRKAYRKKLFKIRHFFLSPKPKTLTYRLRVIALFIPHFSLFVKRPIIIILVFELLVGKSEVV